MQAKEQRGTRSAADIRTQWREQCVAGIGQRMASGIKHQDACLRPVSGKGFDVIAQMIGAIQRGIDESERSWRRGHARVVVPLRRMPYAITP